MKSTDILVEVRRILSAKWQLDPARTVPDLDRVGLKGNHGIQIEGTVLYADMTDSTKLVDSFRAEFAAEVYKSFLYGACKVITDWEGEVTAFDGDRVMAVFMGGSKNTNAATCALKMNYLVREINNAIAAQYPTTSYKLSQHDRHRYKQAISREDRNSRQQRPCMGGSGRKLCGKNGSIQ